LLSVSLNRQESIEKGDSLAGLVNTALTCRKILLSSFELAGSLRTPFSHVFQSPTIHQNQRYRVRNTL
jgi:hypothetical protein